MNRAAGFGLEIPCVCTGFMGVRPTQIGSRTSSSSTELTDRSEQV